MGKKTLNVKATKKVFKEEEKVTERERERERERELRLLERQARRNRRHKRQTKAPSVKDLVCSLPHSTADTFVEFMAKASRNHLSFLQIQDALYDIIGEPLATQYKKSIQVWLTDTQRRISPDTLAKTLVRHRQAKRSLKKTISQITRITSKKGQLQKLLNKHKKQHKRESAEKKREQHQIQNFAAFDSVIARYIRRWDRAHGKDLAPADQDTDSEDVQLVTPQMQAYVYAAVREFNDLQKVRQEEEDELKQLNFDLFACKEKAREKEYKLAQKYYNAEDQLKKKDNQIVALQAHIKMMEQALSRSKQKLAGIKLVGVEPSFAEMEYRALHAEAQQCYKQAKADMLIQQQAQIIQVLCDMLVIKGIGGDAPMTDEDSSLYASDDKAGIAGVIQESIPQVVKLAQDILMQGLEDSPLFHDALNVEVPLTPPIKSPKHFEEEKKSAEKQKEVVTPQNKPATLHNQSFVPDPTFTRIMQQLVGTEFDEVKLNREQQTNQVQPLVDDIRQRTGLIIDAEHGRLPYVNDGGIMISPLAASLFGAIVTPSFPPPLNIGLPVPPPVQAPVNLNQQQNRIQAIGNGQASPQSAPSILQEDQGDIVLEGQDWSDVIPPSSSEDDQ